MSTEPSAAPVEVMADALVTAGEAIKQAADVARDEKVAAAEESAALAVGLAQTAVEADAQIAVQLAEHERNDQWLREQLESLALQNLTNASDLASLSTQVASLMLAVEALALIPSPTPETEEPPTAASPAAAQVPAPPSPPPSDADDLPAQAAQKAARKVRAV